MTRVDGRRRWVPTTAASRMPVAAFVLAVAVLLPLVPQAARAGVLPRANREPPSVVGMTLPEAQAAIAEQWYPRFAPTVRVVPDLPEQVPADAALVLDQTVVQYLEESSETDPAAVIDLTVGSVVADLEGLTRDEAQTVVDALGLYLKPSGVGLVTTQDPAALSRVPFGTTVQVELVPPVSTTPPTPTVRTPTITVTTGGTASTEGPTTQVAVPDVTGLEPQVVQRVLTAAGLALDVDPTGEDEGLSFRQDPQAGELVPPGSTVTVAFAAVVDSGPAAWAGWPAAAGVGAVGLLGLLTLRSVRSRRPPRDPPAPPDVRVRPQGHLPPRGAKRRGKGRAGRWG